MSPPDAEGLRLLAQATLALESGDTERTLNLLEKTDRDWTGTRLVRARLLLRQGETVRALAEIESARNVAPTDGRVWATSAELYCALGRLSAAEEEIRAGLEICGETPDLLRARGILLLGRQGGAGRAVGHLVRARELDPELPFVDNALAEGHLLLGREHLREQRPTEAVRSARAGLEIAPDDFDLRQLHADGLLAVGALRQAVDVFEELLDDGHSVEADLAGACKRAGMGELIAGRRPAGLELFLRARELGMSDEVLGAAATMLSDEADKLANRGIELYREGKVEEARDTFAEALHFDPDHVGAENHLAVAHYRLGYHGLAIDGWERVLGLFEERDAHPPEPVRLNIARGWLALGRPENARQAVGRWRKAIADAGVEPTAEWQVDADALERRAEAELAERLPRAAGE